MTQEEAIASLSEADLGIVATFERARAIVVAAGMPGAAHQVVTDLALFLLETEPTVTIDPSPAA